MICPKCGASVQQDANFCQKCAFNFTSIPQVEPIQIPIPLPAEEEPATVIGHSIAPPQPQVIVEKSSNTGIIIMLSLMLLAAISVIGVMAFLFINSPKPAAVNATPPNLNANAAAPKPSPSPDYEDWKNSIAPETRRVTLLDEQFEVQPDTHRSERFSILSEVKSARLVGGLRATNGAVNFYVYAAKDYEDFPDTTAKPALFEQTRNKKINARLEPGEYVIVFETPPESNKPVTVASELLLVYD